MSLLRSLIVASVVTLALQGAVSAEAATSKTCTTMWQRIKAEEAVGAILFAEYAGQKRDANAHYSDTFRLSDALASRTRLYKSYEVAATIASRYPACFKPAASVAIRKRVDWVRQVLAYTKQWKQMADSGRLRPTYVFLAENVDQEFMSLTVFK